MAVLTLWISEKKLPGHSWLAAVILFALGREHEAKAFGDAGNRSISLVKNANVLNGGAKPGQQTSQAMAIGVSLLSFPFSVLN